LNMNQTNSEAARNTITRNHNDLDAPTNNI
jgi:hypothetical protein